MMGNSASTCKILSLNLALSKLVLLLGSLSEPNTCSGSFLAQEKRVYPHITLGFHLLDACFQPQEGQRYFAFFGLTISPDCSHSFFLYLYTPLNAGETSSACLSDLVPSLAWLSILPFICCPSGFYHQSVLSSRPQEVDVLVQTVCAASQAVPGTMS